MTCRVQIVEEPEGWAVVIDGLPVHGEGSTRDEAIDDVVGALREYAGHWSDHLYKAQNHASNWPVVFWVDDALDHEVRRALLDGSIPPEVEVDGRRAGISDPVEVFRLLKDAADRLGAIHASRITVGGIKDPEIQAIRAIDDEVRALTPRDLEAQRSLMASFRKRYEALKQQKN